MKFDKVKGPKDFWFSRGIAQIFGGVVRIITFGRYTSNLEFLILMQLLVRESEKAEENNVDLL